MGFLGLRILRNEKLLRRSVLSFNRTIMTSNQLRAKIEKAEEELKSNPYFAKYSEKIAKLQQTSPEEFLSRVEATKVKKQKSTEDKTATTKRDYTSILNPKKPLDKKVDLQEEALSKVMKIELVRDEDAEGIAKIWQEYHKQKDFIAATIPAKAFDKIDETSKLYPTFLFPIPRSQGYEFIVCQFSKNTVHFTPLLNFQVHKENAPECLTITHYTEFKESKGIVLMRGEFDKSVINCQEAQCLANQLQLYYSLSDPEKTKLLERFTKKPDEFKHMDLIKQIESLSIV